MPPDDEPRGLRDHDGGSPSLKVEDLGQEFDLAFRVSVRVPRIRDDLLDRLEPGVVASVLH